MASDENQRRLTANYHLSNKVILFKNFLGGIAWGFGSVIGATIIVAILIAVLSQLKFIGPVSNILDTLDPKKIEENIDDYESTE